MRLAIPVGYALSAAATIALLAGCSGGSSQLATTPAGPSGSGPQQMSTHRGFPAGRIVAAIPNGQNIIAHPSKVKSWMSPQARLTPIVYVSDFSAGTVTVFDQKGKNQTAIGTISGLANPQGMWVQRLGGDLYVVQSGAAVITGYHRGSTTSFITLNDSSVGAEAVSVALTTAGDAYVAHLGSNIISHYAPGATTPTDTFIETNASSLFFITADSTGELFVTYFDASGFGRVDEIIGGVATQLPITLSFPGGVQLDKNENLLVDDQLVPSISTYAPPYATVLNSFTLTGDPVNFSLSGIGWAIWDANAVNLDGERYAYNGPGGTNPNAPFGTLIESTSTAGFQVPISAYCDKARPT